ncbi:MAG: YbaB/EbfC family nucleoid-associated protein, partial [Anaerolineales bacterium]
TQDASEGPPAAGDLFRNVEAELRTARDDLARQTVEASSAGGEVRLEMSGTQVCRKVSITLERISPDTARELEALVEEAVNRAIQESQQLAARRLGPLAGGGR